MASTEPDLGHSSTRQHGHDAHHADENKAKKRVPDENIARLVAEENANRSKFPRYPGLERWELVEKMGDGAFSNVYRARDREGNAGEVAIKVVRKYEMNSMQVRGTSPWHRRPPFHRRRTFSLVAVVSLSFYPSSFTNSRRHSGQQAASSGLQAKGPQGCRGARTFYSTPALFTAFLLAAPSASARDAMAAESLATY